jgi:nitroreductase
MDVLGLIKSRRSVREFTSEDVAEEVVREILEAGRWAPSGLNNQPWRFSIVRDSKVKGSLSKLTRYGEVIQCAPVCIAVFLDKAASYDRTKDVLAVGACIQNMLLAAHFLGLGAVWLGEILKNKEKIGKLLGVPADCELMAVVALGHPAEEGASDRKTLKDLLL